MLRVKNTLLAALLVAPLAVADDWDVSGELGLEFRAFPQTAIDADQHDTYFATSAEVEFYRQWDDEMVTITPFVRLGQHDDNRNHVDFREANWLHIADDWEVKAGLSTVFWGTAESQHLVDIINQTDALEGIDGEDKLGQPMVAVKFIKDWGDLEVFWLPYFRERQFAGEEGRLRANPRIDADYSTYQSEDEQRHQDFAARWVNTVGDLDIAVSYFQGTSRDPSLSAGLDNSGNTILIPHYEQIRQAGLELTWVKDSWIWKAEALRRHGLSNSEGDKEAYTAMVGGFEYTFVGIGESDTDLGLLMEYHYDERGERATTPYQNDIFVGLRFTLNDVKSSELLTGVIFDNDSDATIGFIEASRRIGDNMKVELEARFFNDFDDNDPMIGIENDNFWMLTWSYYF